jgi:hypothetical protein
MHFGSRLEIEAKSRYVFFYSDVGHDRTSWCDYTGRDKDEQY